MPAGILSLFLRPRFLGVTGKKYCAGIPRLSSIPTGFSIYTASLSCSSLFSFHGAPCHTRCRLPPLRKHSEGQIPSSLGSNGFPWIDGLPHSTSSRCLRIVKDTYGIGTNEGLCRYNGYDFITVPTRQSRHLQPWRQHRHRDFEDSTGRLWIGTDGGGLNLFHRETETFTRYLCNDRNGSSISDNSVWAITESRDRTIWTGTRKGLCAYDPRTGRFTRYETATGNSSRIDIGVVRCVYEDKKGVLWAGTNTGIYRYTPGAGFTVPFDMKLANNRNLSEDSIWSMYEDRKGRFWIGTMRAGLLVVDRSDGSFIEYVKDKPHGISDNNVWHIMEDSVGRIWITTANGGLNLFHEVPAHSPATVTTERQVQRQFPTTSSR